MNLGAAQESTVQAVQDKPLVRAAARASTGLLHKPLTRNQIVRPVAWGSTGSLQDKPLKHRARPAERASTGRLQDKPLKPRARPVVRGSTGQLQDKPMNHRARSAARASTELLQEKPHARPAERANSLQQRARHYARGRAFPARTLPPREPRHWPHVSPVTQAPTAQQGPQTARCASPASGLALNGRPRKTIVFLVMWEKKVRHRVRRQKQAAHSVCPANFPPLPVLLRALVVRWAGSLRKLVLAPRRRVRTVPRASSPKS
jgi:hypothetical protein